jgi:hypothetical protein
MQISWDDGTLFNYIRLLPRWVIYFIWSDVKNGLVDDINLSDF